MKITFTVPGDPVSWERPIHTANSTFTPKKSKAYQRMVGQYARIAMLKAGWKLTRLPVAVSALFVVPDNRRRDTDNLLKNLGDSFIGVVLHDDTQIVEIHATKRVAGEGEKTRAEVCVETVEAAEPEVAA